jgi:hypothetical protein
MLRDARVGLTPQIQPADKSEWVTILRDNELSKFVKDAQLQLGSQVSLESAWKAADRWRRLIVLVRGGPRAHVRSHF